MPNTPVIASIEGVSKRFIMHKEKTVKERLLNFKNARNSREDFWALQNVDLEIKAGSTVGLAGHNGSGKSTLLKIIGGIIEPTTGNVYRRGRIAPLLELGAGFHPDLTGRENIFLNAAILGLSRAETERHFDEIVDFSGIESFIDTQVKFYSSGMYVRLAFSIAVHVDPDFLLVDEVLAVGDQPFQQKCMAKIAEFQRDGRTIALVSHSEEQISSLCDSVVVLENGRILHNGETEEGLRILRSGYARMHPANSENFDNHIQQTLGIGEVVAAIENNCASQIAHINNLSVEFPFTISSAMPGWKLEISVWTTGDQLLFSMNSEDLGINLPTNHERGIVRFHLESIPLNSGSYSISFVAITDDGAVLDSRNPAASFEITSDGDGHGPLKVSANAKISLG